MVINLQEPCLSYKILHQKLSFQFYFMFGLVKAYHCDSIFCCISFFWWLSPVSYGDNNDLLLLVIVLPKAITDKQIVTAVHTLHLSENLRLHNSLSKMLIHHFSKFNAKKIHICCFCLVFVVSKADLMRAGLMKLQLKCTLFTCRYRHCKITLILNTCLSLSN